MTRVLRESSHGQTKAATIRALRTEAATSIGLTEAAIERTAEPHGLLARWALLNQQVAAVEEAISAAVAACPEATLLCTLPELGPGAPRCWWGSWATRRALTIPGRSSSSPA